MGTRAVKQIVAKSAWWTKGQGAQPGEAAAWMDDQRLLAEHGDRPAMLDFAFATGYGRTRAQDRGAAVAAYLKVIDKSDGADEASKRVRLSAGRESMSESTQALCFLAGANSIFTGDKLLTAPNAGDDSDAAMFAKLGLKPLAGPEPQASTKAARASSCG